MCFEKYAKEKKYVKFKVGFEETDAFYGGLPQFDEKGDIVIQVSTEAAKKMHFESDWFYKPYADDEIVSNDVLETDNPKVVALLQKYWERTLEEMKDYDNDEKKEYLESVRHAMFGVHQVQLISHMLLKKFTESVDKELETLDT